MVVNVASVAERGSMLKFRLISFVAILGVLAFVFFNPYGIIGFGILATLVAGLMVYELCTMLENLELRSYKWLSTIYTTVLFGLNSYGFFAPHSDTMFIIASFWVLLPFIVGWILVLSSSQFAVAVKKLITSVGVVMLVFPIIRGLMSLGEISLTTFAFIALATKSGDTGAYCVGMLSNQITKGKNHPVAPRISPKKSIEGTIGGMIICVGVTLLLNNWLEVLNFSTPMVAIMGILIFWGGFFGDLTESVLKRGCGIKDSGRILPGMGGIWDLMDSFIFNAIIFGMMFRMLGLY